MRKSVFPCLMVALVAGCASTEPASTPDAGTPGTQSQSQAQSRGTGAQAPMRSETARGQQPVRGQAKAVTDVDSVKSVYYEFDGVEVRPEYRPLVTKHAMFLRDNPSARITIEGNADERGSREYNVALGQKRAESVMKMMLLLGARANQIEPVSFGEEKPMAQGHDEAAWAENRRSDFAKR